MPYILVVDDDMDARAMTILALQENGFKAIGASNGLEALLFVMARERKTRPYLILLDLNMPIMGGHELIQVLRYCGHLSDIPVVIVSGSPDTPPGYRSLTKPIQLDILLQVATQARDQAADTAKTQVPLELPHTVKA